MDIHFIVFIGLFFALLFWLLSYWQRSVERASRQEELAALQESHERGSHKPIAQYPQIDPYLCIGCGSCVAVCPEKDVLGLVNGIAHLLNGSHCVGHALCEAACPVGAIKVGLGNIALRPDIPILSPDMETSIPGVFIAGELGGMALIKHAILQGTRAIDTITGRLQTNRPDGGDVLDVLIVGAGPAGLAASMRATEKRLRFKTISQDDVGGTVLKYPRRKLTLVQAVEMPLFGKLPGREYAKEELVDLWNRLVAQYNIPIQVQCAFEGLVRRGDVLETKTSAGILRSRFVILATGRRGTPRKLGVPGEHQAKVLYQLIDTASYVGHHLLVVGGGDSAVEAATGLADQRGNSVTLSYRKPEFFRIKKRNMARVREYTASRRLRVIFSSEIERVDAETIDLRVGGGGQRQNVRLRNDFVFVLAGGVPPYPLLKDIGIRFGGDGHSPMPNAVAA